MHHAFSAETFFKNNETDVYCLREHFVTTSVLAVIVRCLLGTRYCCGWKISEGQQQQQQNENQQEGRHQYEILKTLKEYGRPLWLALAIQCVIIPLL